MVKGVLLILISLFASFAFSQETGSIKGNITDAEMYNEPLLFAQISLKNTSITAQTNFHGNFVLSEIDPGDYKLTISYPGYEAVEIQVTIEKERVTRINRSLAARTVDVNSILNSDTGSTASFDQELTGPDQ